MSLICKLFGHTMQYPAGSGHDYGEVYGGYADGIRRQHYQLRVKCSRCGEKYHAGSFHGPLSLYANPKSRPQDPDNQKTPE